MIFRTLLCRNENREEGIMKEKQIKNFERNIKIAVAGLALVVVVLGICSFLQFTKPYAVTEDGTKVEEPWEVKI